MKNCTRPIRDAALVGLAAVLLCAIGWGLGSDDALQNANAYKATPKTFVYIEVTDQTGASSVAQFRLTNTGRLRPLIPATVSAGNSVSGLAIVPGSNHLYALNEDGYPTQSTFLRFSINRGRLAPNSIASPGPIVTPYPFTLSPDGRFALVPALPSWTGTLNSYSISGGGVLTLVSSVSAGTDPCKVAIDPTGKFAYVADNGGKAIFEYNIAADGTLTPIGSIPTGAHDAPYFLGFSPEGFLYSAGCCQPQVVSEYSIDSSTGALTHLNDFPSGDSPLSNPWSVAFDPTGKYAYVSNTNPVISAYAISLFTVNRSTGALTRNGPDIPAAGALQIAVDPSGKFVYALAGDTVYQFKISRSGRLVPNGTASLPGSAPPETGGAIAFVQH